MRIPIDQLPLGADAEGARIQRRTWAGSTVRVLELPAGGHLGRVPDRAVHELCPSAHWGYVLEGSVEVRFAFGERETARTGDVYYWPALHACWTDDGVRLLEFSPATEGEPATTACLTPAGS